MKKIIFLFAILMATAFVSHAQIRIGLDVIMGNRPPSPSESEAMKREEAAHPNITDATSSVHRALIDLQNSPDDFGGHKRQAINDLTHAYVSLRKCLYYRLFVDTGR